MVGIWQKQRTDQVRKRGLASFGGLVRGLSAEGARVGMNDRTWEDDVAAPLRSPSHLHALPSVPLPNPCSQARPASSLNLKKPEKEVRAGDAGRAALETHSPLLFLSGLKGAGELAGGRRRDHFGPVPAPCSPPFLSFPPTTAPRRVERRMLKLGHTPGNWA